MPHLVVRLIHYAKATTHDRPRAARSSTHSLPPDTTGLLAVNWQRELQAYIFPPLVQQPVGPTWAGPGGT
jgi:hypothetical protein